MSHFEFGCAGQLVRLAGGLVDYVESIAFWQIGAAQGCFIRQSQCAQLVGMCVDGVVDF